MIITRNSRLCSCVTSTAHLRRRITTQKSLVVSVNELLQLYLLWFSVIASLRPLTLLSSIAIMNGTKRNAAYAFSVPSSSSFIRHHRYDHHHDYIGTGTRLTPLSLSHMTSSTEIIDTISTVASTTTATISSISTTSFFNSINSMTQSQAEQIAGPFFGLSLTPYLLFLYFLDTSINETPKGITVGFATCLLFVFLTIPAAIASEVLYGVSLADCDWLHGSAESLLTITNLVTVVGFRQALKGKEIERWKSRIDGNRDDSAASDSFNQVPLSVTSYKPMIVLVGVLTLFATITVLIPLINYNGIPDVHTPYLGGFMDLPSDWVAGVVGRDEPENALTVGCWIIHISSLVEFLVAMGFAWRWADIVQNPKWKGLTWGLIPLHSSGITACTYHLFYNQLYLLVPLQAFLTCVGNTTAAFAAYRIAVSNGWMVDPDNAFLKYVPFLNKVIQNNALDNDVVDMDDLSLLEKKTIMSNIVVENSSLIGFEDLGDALAEDNDYTFLVKLFTGCALASYGIKYGELFFDFPFEANLGLGLTIIFIPSLLNALKWYKRSLDPTFEGWF